MEIILGIYGVVSLVAFIFYGFDKRRAIRGGRRIPEATLHTLELFGGFPGAFLAQQLFRHKTRKKSFLFVFWAIVALHLGFWTWWFNR
jgi:uncharacterized membrane protein YsdA (DUF1294 family)